MCVKVPHSGPASPSPASLRKETKEECWLMTDMLSMLPTEAGAAQARQQFKGLPLYWPTHHISWDDNSGDHVLMASNFRLTWQVKWKIMDCKGNISTERTCSWTSLVSELTPICLSIASLTIPCVSKLQLESPDHGGNRLPDASASWVLGGAPPEAHHPWKKESGLSTCHAPEVWSPAAQLWGLKSWSKPCQVAKLSLSWALSGEQMSGGLR